MAGIKSTTKFFIFLALILILPMAVFAKIGVGVGLGKIHLDEPLRAGGIYNLPSLPVLNTGDEPSDYAVGVDYFQDQETRSDMGLRPAAEWFHFEPQSFHLEPGNVQMVKITLTLPTKDIKPVNYFAYLEAHPVKKSEAGVTAVNIAAATKLWFTVAPSNIFQGIYYRFITLYSHYHPWDTIVLAVIFVAALLRFVSKKFKFQIARK
ncbi:MAG: hypothetical protein PHT16_00040 [Candidatus Pacebacteria bacterium]|nr:hypothetical protein [Candidatus Paceibacterota bacterium]